MKKLLLSILILVSFKTYSQIDTIHKNYISLNLFQMGVNAEAGISYERVLNNRYSLCLAIGHRFNDFHLTKVPSFIFPSAKYTPQRANAASLGIKRFYKLGRYKKIKKYCLLAIHFKNTQLKGNWEYKYALFGGEYRTNQYNESATLFGVSFGTGIERYNNEKFIYDLGVSIGIYAGERKRVYIKMYEWDSVNSNYYLKPTNIPVNDFIVFPFVQARLNFGCIF